MLPPIPAAPSAKSCILENPDAAVLPAPNPTVIINPRSVYLRDHVSIATIHPVFSAAQIPLSLIAFLHEEFNAEIERGDTYPLEEPLDLEKFTNYWFGTFAAVMLMGTGEQNENMNRERDWATECLGAFYIKPNYPGRSSHVCNAGFLTTLESRGKGCGKHMGEAYLDFAPKLGYTYSIFNLVYETNIASCKIWDSLGFKRIGKVKGAGRLRSYPHAVDAIIYGRDLNDDEDYVSDERFDKIRFYLEKGKYPPSADRSEKSRLRSAATHYRLDSGKLMLKDKEVVSDSQMQYEIARTVHCQSHGGINKTTANIAEKYHWVRIKETVSQVIRNCTDCKEHAKIPIIRGERFLTHPAPPQPQVQSPQQAMMLNHAQAEAARAAAVAAAAEMDIPVDPAMMEDIQHQHQHHQHQHQHHPHHHHSMQQQYAPVASMHSGNSLDDNSNQRHAAEAAARAALSEGDVLATEEDRVMGDRHLMETLVAEMKRDEGGRSGVGFAQNGHGGEDERDTERQLVMEMDRV